MNSYPIYCAGQFTETKQVLPVINPFTQQAFATTFLADASLLEKAIEAGIQSEKAMKSLPVYKRYAILKHIADSLQKRQEAFAQVLACEAGKPLRHARAEVSRAIQTFIVASEECKRLPAEYMSIDWTPEARDKEAIVRHFPLGLVAGISPFNFPLNLAVHKIAPAIAAGCPIILKPASNTPLSTLLLAQILDETELPKGSVSILPMDRTTGNILVTDNRIKLLSFTGSPDVGWEMKNNAGRKKVVLELGGNAGVIVAESADVGLAAQRAAVGGFAYAGQICIHAQRFFVHVNHFDAFLKALLPLVRAFRTGDVSNPDTDFSVMIDEKNAKRAQQWINEAVREGARIVYGGQRDVNFLEPTILTDTHAGMKVNAMEVFAPVITVTPFTRFEQAVEMLNDGRFGLQAGVFTNMLSEMNYAFENIETGGVIINDIPTFRVDHMPYGGVKDSGLGREGVRYAILDMMEPRILIKNK